MGDAVAIVKQLIEQLSSSSFQEFWLLWGFEDSVKSLKDDFKLIEAVLEDAEEKHISNKGVEEWLRRLKSASMEVENVLDEISTRPLLRRVHEERGTFRCWTMVSTDYLLHHLDGEERGIFRFWKLVSAFFTSNQLVFSVMIAHKVKEIKKKLDDIASQRFVLNLTTSGPVKDREVQGDQMPNRETSSLILDSSSVFGRDEEVEKVTKKICNNDMGRYENGEILVYGIWGMGGVGKTTLAQLVYNHESVNQCFKELKYWIYVSQNFQVKEIIKGIITSIDTDRECTFTRLNELQVYLQNKLRGKKFLIVLDDVWIEEGEKTKWEKLSEALSCGAEGSIVVMTTRSWITSRMMARVPELQHKLGCLSENDSWLLFKKHAFAQGREGDDISKLEPIGKNIVKKCKGLPLSVKTLGSLMWLKSSTSDWQQVENNNIWDLDETKVLPAILKLSYDNLVPHLKRCFAYCCLFPKGYKMEKDVLIWLWASNGFIQPIGRKDLYKFGEEVLNCLVWRSFFIANIKSWGDITYIMHDLMHDMAQHLMGHDCLVIENAFTEVLIPHEVLHLSSTCPNFHFSPKDLGNLTPLRSILMLGEINELNISQIFSHKYLRVLYLFRIGLRKLPDSVFKLKHLIYLNLQYSSIEVLSESIMYLQNLQYLNLSKSKIEVLPRSINHLQNLQVLLLYRCLKLCNFPEGLGYMKNLQHLDIYGCNLVNHLPIGIKELNTSLRILSRFPIGNESGANIWELGDLNLLEGKLKIEGLVNVRSLSEAKSANLKGKTNLSGLTLKWYRGTSEGELAFSNDDEVLEGLEPNLYLKELKISNFRGKNISPSWMDNLSNLEKIKYSRCWNCEQLPALVRLPNLRVIDLSAMDSLKCFHDEDTNVSGDNTDMFPCVETIKIEHCPNLVSLPSYFPKLKVLELRYCKGLLFLPDKIQSFQNLNELKITRCDHLRERYAGVDWPKISHIPNIEFDLKPYHGP